MLRQTLDVAMVKLPSLRRYVPVSHVYLSPKILVLQQHGRVLSTLTNSIDRKIVLSNDEPRGLSNMQIKESKLLKKKIYFLMNT